MSIFKTYKEAVISNGATKCVYKNEITGEFCHLTQGGPIINICWAECNPADYLETLESFLASGKRLKYGDLYVELHGVVTKALSETDTNTKSSRDRKRFVLQSSVDDVETPEEKEAFDAIDTTPQQVESLGNAGWNGEGLPPIGEHFCVDDYDTVMLCKYSSEYVVVGEMTGEQYPEGVDVVIDLKQTPNRKFCKPESQAEREERERDEMAKQLMIDMHGDGIFDKRDWNYQKRYSLSAQQAFNLIDAGYRKEDK